MDAGHHECPACRHRWPVQCDALAGLPDFTGQEPPKAPRIARIEASAVLAAWDAWEARAAERARYRAIVEAGEPTGARGVDLAAAEAALRLAEQRATIAAALAAIVVPEDRSAELAERRRYEAEMRVYAAALDARMAWEKEAAAARLRLAEIGPRPDMAALDARIARVAEYEMRREAHEDLVRRRAEGEAVVARHRAEAARWKAARDALLDVRSRTQTHLLPALGQAAGALVARITGGAFSKVDVDESFDVRVDGQPLATLSGSESTAVNLALRIALGQLLTNRVFSVFAGDEVDADMDEDRAARTAEALRGLSGAVRQTIVVSHKRIAADHHVDL